jgi:hypothetical protein
MQPSQSEISGPVGKSPVVLLSNQQCQINNRLCVRSNTEHQNSGSASNGTIVSVALDCGTTFASCSRNLYRIELHTCLELQAVLIGIIYARGEVMYSHRRAELQRRIPKRGVGIEVLAGILSQNGGRVGSAGKGVGKGMPLEFIRCLKFESDFACPPMIF